MTSKADALESIEALKKQAEQTIALVGGVQGQDQLMVDLAKSSLDLALTWLHRWDVKDRMAEPPRIGEEPSPQSA